MYLPKVADRTQSGYPILAVKYAPAPDPDTAPEEGILLCIRPGNTFEPFVVWRFMTAGSGATFSGGYHNTLESALDDFEKTK